MKILKLEVKVVLHLHQMTFHN